MEDLRKSKRLPDQTVFGLKLGQKYPRNKKKQIAEQAEESAKLQAARCNSGIYEVLIEDKDSSMWLLMLVSSDTYNLYKCQQGTVRFKKYRSMRKSEVNTHGPHCRKKSHVGSFHNGLTRGQSLFKKQ